MVTLGLACFAVVLAVTLLLVAPKPVYGLAPLTQRQDAESTLYLLAFGLILPLALIVVPRLADGIAAGPNGGGLALVAAVLIGSLMLSLLVARALPGANAAEALGMFALWWLGAVALLARAGSTRPWATLSRAAPLTSSAWALAAGLVLTALLAFTSLDSISLLPLGIGIGAILIVLTTHARSVALGLPKVPKRWGLAIDAAIILLLALVIPDLVIFKPAGVGGVGLEAAYKAAIIQFHQDFLLGPANQVLAGDAVLVNTASQYGIGPIYFLAAWFQLVPIGYGTLGFLDGILYVLEFASGYCVLRIAGASRVLASGALALAVVALLYNHLYPVGGLLQHGPLRFGLPMVVILAATVAARWPRHERAATIAQLLAVGLSAIWALEAFAYTLATFAALACLDAYIRAQPRRLRWLARRLATALAICAAAQLAFTGATLALAGHLPDWGQYFAYLNELLFGKLADITYDFAPWSPGLPVGVAYAASIVAIVLVALRSRDLIARERPALVALTGTTAYGAVLFTYFVNRSSTDILPYVSFPAVLIGTLWLALLLRGSLTQARQVRLGGLAFGLSVAILTLAVAWSAIGARFPDTPLARAAAGYESLSSAFHRLWHPPPIDPRAPAGERLVDRYLPRERRILMLLPSDLGTEILIRSGRANELPFGDPFEDSFATFPTVADITEAVDAIQPGDRLLLQQGGLHVLAELRQPSRDPLEHPLSLPPSDSLTSQQQSVLLRIGERFNLRVIARDMEGLVVASLEPRR
ncbi:MAG: hypothetical protein AABM43_02510 [Actinomycetota bacterium]